MPVLLTAFHRTEAHEFYGHKGFEKRAFLFTMELVRRGGRHRPVVLG
jgi:hypothetical protein